MKWDESDIRHVFRLSVWSRRPYRGFVDGLSMNTATMDIAFSDLYRYYAPTTFARFASEIAASRILAAVGKAMG